MRIGEHSLVALLGGHRVSGKEESLRIARGGGEPREFPPSQMKQQLQLQLQLPSSVCFFFFFCGAHHGSLHCPICYFAGVTSFLLHLEHVKRLKNGMLSFACLSLRGHEDSSVGVLPGTTTMRYISQFGEMPKR